LPTNLSQVGQRLTILQLRIMKNCKCQALRKIIKATSNKTIPCHSETTGRHCVPVGRLWGEDSNKSYENAFFLVGDDLDQDCAGNLVKIDAVRTTNRINQNKTKIHPKLWID
jgi:hypothetical protein